MSSPLNTHEQLSDAGLSAPCYVLCKRSSIRAKNPSLPAHYEAHANARGPSAFTLIELLIVIAIIAILAGLAFPAVQGALESGKKAQARNDVHQLAAAIKAYQLEYGRLPGTATSDGPAAPDLMATLTSSNSQNPRGIVFFEPKMARQGKGGLDGTIYKDPWGNPYSITLDYNYDNRISNNFTTAIVTSPGGNNPTATNNIISNIR